MRNAALKGFATATDLADYLVRQDVPFAMHTTSWANSLALRSNDKWTLQI